MGCAHYDHHALPKLKAFLPEVSTVSEMAVQNQIKPGLQQVTNSKSMHFQRPITCHIRYHACTLSLCNIQILTWQEYIQRLWNPPSFYPSPQTCPHGTGILEMKENKEQLHSNFKKILKKQIAQSPTHTPHPPTHPSPPPPNPCQAFIPPEVYYCVAVVFFFITNTLKVQPAVSSSSSWLL